MEKKKYTIYISPNPRVIVIDDCVKVLGFPSVAADLIHVICRSSDIYFVRSLGNEDNLMRIPIQYSDISLQCVGKIVLKLF